MKKLTIDFETRSKEDLKKAGAWKYSRHESTDILCICWKLDEGETFYWSPFTETNFDDFYDSAYLKDLFALATREDVIIEAHNAQFEYCIWHNVGGKKYKFPTLPLEKFYCSAARAAALALPRNLDEVGRALGASVVKDNEGKRIMMKMSKPRKATKNDKSEWHESIEDFKTLIAYCKTDVESEHAFSKMISDLIPSERHVYLMNERMNLRGIYCDVEGVKKALSFIETFSADLTDQLNAVTQGEVTSAGQRDKLIGFLAREGVVLDGLTAKDVEDNLKLETLTPKARAVLNIRQQLSKASTKKLLAMLKMVDTDNRIRGTVLYHGASTGRFAGKGIQPQNFPRGNVKDVDLAFKDLAQDDYDTFTLFHPDVLDDISGMLRGFLMAGPGNKLIAGDFSAIEARVLFWLAGNEKGLENYRKGFDQYKAMASSIYKKPYDQIDKKERQLGKTTILGAGYGMGRKKFLDTCHAQGLTWVDEEVATLAINTYRETHQAVPIFWKVCEAAALKAIRNPGMVIDAGKFIKYSYRGRFLYARLPSGRKIAYYKPHFKFVETDFGPKPQLQFWGVDSKTKKWGVQKTYGGKLCENITQAVARCFMTDSMKVCEDAGYFPVMTVHDELVCEVPEDFGSAHELEKLMMIVPKWGEGCPIGAEAWQGPRYKK